MIKLKDLLNEDKIDNYEIFIDLDGVLCDFDGQLRSIGIGNGRQYEKKYGTESFWEVIGNEGVEFWSKMSWMSDGKKLWNYIKNMNPRILSAPAKTLPQSRIGKKKWVKNNLGNYELILKSASEKQQYAKPNRILIDDMEKNIKQWNASGGIGILHKSASSTISKLKNILGK